MRAGTVNGIDGENEFLRTVVSIKSFCVCIIFLFSPSKLTSST